MTDWKQATHKGSGLTFMYRDAPEMAAMEPKGCTVTAVRILGPDGAAIEDNYTHGDNPLQGLPYSPREEAHEWVTAVVDTMEADGVSVYEERS